MKNNSNSYFPNTLGRNKIMWIKFWWFFF